jgi:TIGR03009 family protein
MYALSFIVTLRKTKMMRFWIEFRRAILLGYAVMAPWLVSISMNTAVAQQPAANQGQAQRSNQSVAPPANGYGNRSAQPTQQRPIGTNAVPANTAQQPAAASSQPNGQAPANLNPNLNQGQPPAMNPTPPGARVPGIGSGSEIVTADPYAANPLTPQEQEFVDKVLGYWEQSTANITHYACKFKRWQFNSSDNFVAQLATSLKADIRSIHTSVAAGEVKYMAPDQGMFKVDRLMSLTGQLAANRPEYKEFDNRFGEWWLCDGKVVYDYDRTRKHCRKIELPPEMRGTAILDSPMPFVFGVKAAKLKERYWVRILPTNNNEVVLVEVYPKFQADAVNYDHVHIYLDRKEFLPVNLVKFNTGHVDKQGEILKDDREIFEFTDREKNQSLLQKMNQVILRNSFIPFDIPSDWKVEDTPYAPVAAGNVRAAGLPAAQAVNGTAPANPIR